LNPRADQTDTADVVVVAAGTSRRMGGIDKIEAPVAGQPLLAWTLDRLAEAPEVGRIAVVVSEDRVETLRAAAWLNPKVAAVVGGGGRRQESVAAGVAALDAPDHRIVLVHDGARPLVSRDLVSSAVAAARSHGAAIPVMSVRETVKRVVDGLVVETLDREVLATAQTPQAVRMGLLRAAWSTFPADGSATFTDEAALLEAARIPVHAFPGDPTNLKVTVPADLDRAATLLGGPAVAALRVGFGTDHHPFGPGRPLALGGITFETGPRLHGHSDGDVVLHAVADALLGAAGLGDLGRLFPAGPETPRGIASRTMVEETVRRVRDAGFEPESLGVTIVGARPRLGRRLTEMRAAIAEVVGLPVDAVEVKASTGNLGGAEGAGRAVSAHAVAVLRATASGAGRRSA
jgi:2-C-methyl-D-erythritol 4-phosphate cytidylyltransferase/2-C-methyl-D-erythritol 2,4-cyclodiphosphate synthase